jgi:hypothetical protein
MLVDVPVAGKVGEKVESYFANFGRLTGIICETSVGRFLLELDMTPEKRERMSTQLTWLEKKLKDPTIQDARKDARIVPANPHSTLTLADGSVYGCFVIDMSGSGVAVSAEVQPPIGTPLAVGACVGRVVRPLPNGFAVQFIERQKRSDLNLLIGRRTPSVPVADAGISKAISAPPAGPDYLYLDA